MGARGWSFTKAWPFRSPFIAGSGELHSDTKKRVPEMMIWLGKTDFGQIRNKLYYYDLGILIMM